MLKGPLAAHNKYQHPQHKLRNIMEDISCHS